MQPADDPSRGVFAISVTAELTGIHPQTLRVYEREGFVRPARSAGGTRRYSRDDVDQLNEIAALVATGLNIRAVRRILQLQTENRALREQITAERDGRDGSPQR